MDAIDILPREIWYHILDYIDDYDTYNNLPFVCQLFMKYCQINDRNTITENSFDIIIHYGKRQVLKYCIYIDNIQIRPFLKIDFTIEDISNTFSIESSKYCIYFYEKNYTFSSSNLISKRFFSLNEMFNYIQKYIKPFNVNKFFKIFKNKIMNIYGT